MSDTELAWAAGLFDGEGSFTTHRSGSGGVNHDRIRLYLRSSIAQASDPFVLHRFRAAVGVGKVYGPYNYYRERQAIQWRYLTSKMADTLVVLEKLKPYLSLPKLAQADAALARCRTSWAEMPVAPRERDPLTGKYRPSLEQTLEAALPLKKLADDLKGL